MTNVELKWFSLEETEETKEVVKLTGEPVYRIIGFENTLVSTWDFVRHKQLPEGIWSISKATNDGIFQLHINQSMLKANNNSAAWAASMLEMQIYLKNELDDK